MTAAPPAQSNVPALVTLEDEIRAGLPMDCDRREAARANEAYYEGKNNAYFPAQSRKLRPGERAADYNARPKVYSRLLRKAVRTLTSLLYAPGPARKLIDPEAEKQAKEAERMKVIEAAKANALTPPVPPDPNSIDTGEADPTAEPDIPPGLEPPEPPTASEQWLDLAWKSNHINRLMHQADVKATMNDVCAIQAVGTGKEDCPVRLYLWGAEEFTAYCSGDDPCEPWAVVTMTVMEANRKKWRRYEAWSAQEHRVYETNKVNWTEDLPTTGGTDSVYRRDLSGTNGDGINPYGCLPFTFVWHERPVSRFWGGGIGDMLRECNEVTDWKLSAIGEHIDVFLNPDLYYTGVQAGTSIERKPNQPIILPAANVARDNPAMVPTAMYLQAQLGVQDGWWDAQKYVNQTFHELDVPLSAVRDDQQGPQSGIQVEAERGPLLDYTRQRQSQFGEYEEAVAKLILRVGGNYYGNEELVTAADTQSLTVTWTKPSSSIRTAEDDDHDKFDLDEGLATRISVLMKRGMTREEAIDYLEQLSEDRDIEDQLFPPAVQPSPFPPGVNDTNANGQNPPDPNAGPMSPANMNQPAAMDMSPGP